jgi:hypothetical protein
MSTVSCKKKTPRKPKIYTVKTLDSRTHAFNVGIAKDYSPDMGIWLQHLAFWTEKNLAHENNIHDGRVWCYDTLDDLLEYFPYFSRRQLETIINNSVKEGLVSKGNYNQTGYDRTCWYALNPKAYFYFQYLLTKKNKKRIADSISQICEMEITDLWNGFFRSVTTIPDTIPDTDPNMCGEDAAAPSTHTNLKNLKKEKAEKNALQDQTINEFYSQKFEGYNISIEDLFKSCQEHYEQKSLWATKDKFLKWLKNEKIENHSKYNAKFNKVPENETDQERQARQFIQNEIDKERNRQGYISKFLENNPEMRKKYA